MRLSGASRFASHFRPLNTVGQEFHTSALLAEKLAAVGEGGFHGGIALPVEDRHGEAAVEQRIGGGDAGDAGADDGDVMHGVTPRDSVAVQDPSRSAALGPDPSLSRVPERLPTRIPGRLPLRRARWDGPRASLQSALAPWSFCLRVSGAVAPSAPRIRHRSEVSPAALGERRHHGSSRGVPQQRRGPGRPDRLRQRRPARLRSHRLASGAPPARGRSATSVSAMRSVAVAT